MTNHAAAPQSALLVVWDETIDAPSVRTPQSALLTVEEGSSNPRVPQSAVLYVYNEGSREDFSLRAWSFFLDGNWFYVLHLGLQGTWVYSVNAEQWYEWRTAGYDSWNAEQGLVWDSRIVAGDNQNGTLWEIQPETQLDEGFRPITHESSAVVNASGRQTIVVDCIDITASVGFPTGVTPLVQLSFSDDQGETWVTMDDCDVTLVEGDYSQEIAFRSLGSFGAPGRIFKITDVGGTVRIDRAEIEMH